MKMSKLTCNVPVAKSVSRSESHYPPETENGPQLVGIKNTPILDHGQEMGPLATKIECPQSVNEDITYYGIFIPPETKVVEDNEHICVSTDKDQALKIVKRYKKARFKAFKTREDAEEFALHGSEILNNTIITQNDVPEAASPAILEKTSLYKGPKPQDLVQLRKHIEVGDLEAVSFTVWSNPRYLVSSGDTPAILHEGCRYNALHVAAKARSTAMTEFIIQTVSDPSFVGLLYGDDDPESCQERVSILLDLYLNTPDKGQNETPLHFAVKFGAVGVVEALVSCPQCDRNPKNKFGQTPKDMVCYRISSPDPNLKREIVGLLEERYYVPVLRSEDNSIQPVVGSPFSPTKPLALDNDPINPRMEIHAYAGPMSHEDAVVFRKKWKTPPRIQRTSLRQGAPSAWASSLRLQDTEKGLERVGRELAQEFRVSWKEFWPFLGIFTDLSTPEGLQKLEVYLKNRFMQVYMKSPPKENMVVKSPIATEEHHPVSEFLAPGGDAGDGAISPMSDLCLAFKACSLSETDVMGKSEIRRCATKLIDLQGGEMCSNAENDALMTALTNPGLSPFLYVEKSCQVFAKRIADGLRHLVVIEEAMRDTQSCSESAFDFLLVEVKHLQVLVNSYMDDPRFVTVDFHLVHSRIASLVGSKIHKLSSWDVEFIISCLRLALLAHKGIEPPSSDEEDINSANTIYRTRKSLEKRKRSDVSSQKHVKCLAQFIVDALNKLEESDLSNAVDIRVDTEDDCMQVWSDAITCTCIWPLQNFSRNTRKGASLKRNHNLKPVVSDVLNYQDKDVSHRISSNNFQNRRLSFSNCDTGKEDERKIGINHNSFSRHSSLDFKYHDDTDTDEGSESDADDAFYTPPTSPEEASSEEEMTSAEEGVGVYIEGETPSKMDLAVLQAINCCNITAAEYPNVYRWKHLVLLHNEKERNSWASPAFMRQQHRGRFQRAASPLSSSSRVLRSCQEWSSPQTWHRVAGRYTPTRPNSHVD